MVQRVDVTVCLCRSTVQLPVSILARLCSQWTDVS